MLLLFAGTPANQRHSRPFLFHASEGLEATDFALQKKMLSTRFARRKSALWITCALQRQRHSQRPKTYHASTLAHRFPGSHKWIAPPLRFLADTDSCHDPDAQPPTTAWARTDATSALRGTSPGTLSARVPTQGTHGSPDPRPYSETAPTPGAAPTRTTPIPPRSPSLRLPLRSFPARPRR